MYEEPDAFKEMLEYVSEFYIEVMKQQIYYCKPDIFGIMDDDAAYRMPFFSVDMYREFFKPLQQKHIDAAHENGMIVTRHDCGKCEQFIPDWIEMDVRAWDNQGTLGRADCDIQYLKDSLAEYVDTFAHGGGFTYSAHLSAQPTEPGFKERNHPINTRCKKLSFGAAFKMLKHVKNSFRYGKQQIIVIYYF